jgi:hypothetical protein
MAAPWEGVVQTTIANYMREVSDNTIRFQQFLALLQSKGNILYNQGGTRFEWKVQFKQKQMQTYVDGQTPVFDRINRYQSPTLQYIAYQLPESVTKLETLANQAPEAIVSLMSGKAELLAKEMKQQFGSQPYVDGNASGNENKLQGIESMMSISGAATNGYVGINNDTYAGLSTALGALGGTWTESGGNNTWPRGSGSVDYDFWTPPVVLYDNTSFGSTAAWSNDCEEVLSFAIIHSHRNGGRQGMLDCFMLDRELYRQFMAFQRSRQRYEVSRGASTTGQAGVIMDTAGGTLTSMGFPGVLYHDGVEVTQEFDVTVNRGYGFNFDEMQMLCNDDMLFKTEGPVWNTLLQAYLFFCGYYGQLRINPRAQCSVRSTAGT